MKALVLASSQGIGLAIAEQLYKDGAKVVLCSSNLKRVQTAAKKTGIKRSVVADLNRAGQAKRAVQKAITLLKGLDVLVINSGGPKKGAFNDLSLEDWRAGFQSLWLSGLEAIEAARPSLEASGKGRILWITSTAAREPMKGLNLSSSFRAGLLGLTKALSQELGSTGVTVNCILPGYTHTDRLKELKLPTQTMVDQMSIGRLIEPQEIGFLASFLASERAAAITGQAIAIDGGMLRSH
jgi:3-oxoacyl-[acyl-carrier protein] reductase